MARLLMQMVNNGPYLIERAASLFQPNNQLTR